MSVRKSAKIAGMDACITIAERARLDRPEKIDWRGRPAKRRRVGDVIRWKMNNKTIDQIKSDILAAMRNELGLTAVRSISTKSKRRQTARTPKRKSP